jgi:hypothetical protein
VQAGTQLLYLPASCGPANDLQRVFEGFSGLSGSGFGLPRQDFARHIGHVFDLIRHSYYPT